jgi:hypothetical protein
MVAREALDREIGGANNTVGDEAVWCELKASFAPLET